MIEEVWKDIKGYEGYYKVSNTGLVISKKRVVVRTNGRPIPLKNRILKQQLINGYLHVLLNKIGNIKPRKWEKVHRLVAKAFIPNPLNKPQVNHIDFNKQNNLVTNLEWVTGKENQEHYLKDHKINNRGEKNGNNKLSRKDVLEIRKNKISLQEFIKKYKMGKTAYYDIMSYRSWAHLKSFENRNGTV